MSIKTWNISDLRMIGQKYRSVSGAESLSLRVFNGSFYVGVSIDKQPKPIFNRHWKFNQTFTMAKYMADFAKAEPNTEKTFVFNTYNRAEKKYALDYVLIFKKDEKKLFHFILKANGQTYDFIIRGSNDIAFGTGDIPDEEKSLNEWMFLVNYVKNIAPLQMQLSSFPIEPPAGGAPGGAPQGGYNRGGNGGGYNRGGYTPRPNSSGEFSTTRGLPGDDDLFE